MKVQSLLRGAGSILGLGILFILIGVLVPNDWAIAQLGCEVGVVVTLMGMVGMVAERQGADTARQLPHQTGTPYENKIEPSYQASQKEPSLRESA